MDNQKASVEFVETCKEMVSKFTDISNVKRIRDTSNNNFERVSFQFNDEIPDRLFSQLADEADYQYTGWCNTEQTGKTISFNKKTGTLKTKLTREQFAQHRRELRKKIESYRVIR